MQEGSCKRQTRLTTKDRKHSKLVKRHLELIDNLYIAFKPLIDRLTNQGYNGTFPLMALEYFKSVFHKLSLHLTIRYTFHTMISWKMLKVLIKTQRSEVCRASPPNASRCPSKGPPRPMLRPSGCGGYGFFVLFLSDEHVHSLDGILFIWS